MRVRLRKWNAALNVFVGRSRLKDTFHSWLQIPPIRVDSRSANAAARVPRVAGGSSRGRYVARTCARRDVARAETTDPTDPTQPGGYEIDLVRQFGRSLTANPQVNPTASLQDQQFGKSQEHANQHQVRESQGHGERSCWAGRGGDAEGRPRGRCCSGTVTEFSAPTPVSRGHSCRTRERSRPGPTSETPHGWAAATVRWLRGPLMRSVVQVTQHRSDPECQRSIPGVPVHLRRDARV